jgi:hypothetical protein
MNLNISAFCLTGRMKIMDGIKKTENNNGYLSL